MLIMHLVFTFRVPYLPLSTWETLSKNFQLFIKLIDLLD